MVTPLLVLLVKTSLKGLFWLSILQFVFDDVTYSIISNQMLWSFACIQGS